MKRADQCLEQRSNLYARLPRRPKWQALAVAATPLRTEKPWCYSDVKSALEITMTKIIYIGESYQIVIASRKWGHIFCSRQSNSSVPLSV